MAEAPEEVTVVVDAEDRASPTLLGVGRNIVMLGTNLAMISKELGISNPALNAFINAIELVGHVVRLAYEVQYLYSAALKIVNMLTEENAAATAAATGTQLAQVGATNALTASNYGLAASFAAVNAALGPWGWAMLGLGIAGAAIGGYALGGGFAPPAAAAPVGGGNWLPDVQINIGTANMSSRGEGEAFLQTVGVHLHQQVRTYRS
jgi:hypothetical protein